MASASNPADGVRVHFEVEGAGPPLVLLHGTATSSALWRGLGYVDALSQDFRVVLLDIRGHGRSDEPEGEDAYAMPLLVGDLLAVLDDLGYDEVHLAGYSLGGRVGLAAAARAPERLASLVVGGGSHRPQRAALDRVLYPGFVETIARDGLEAFLDEWSAHAGREISPAVRSVFLANDPAALVPYLRRTEKEPGIALDALARVEAPVLLFAGEHDHERLADSRAVAEALPAATLHVVPGEDHLSTLMRVDKVLPPVTSFLARVTQRLPVPQ